MCCFLYRNCVTLGKVDDTIAAEKLVATETDGTLIGQIDYPFVDAAAKRVFVNPAYRGQGIAGKLMAAFVDYADQAGLTVKLMCPYAKMSFQKHPEYRRLLAPEEQN
ncbi:GNAT family N-acetyltransferase [Limosilactobacillus oris]|uniref:GNAT family N-acetyltransferase n=1 Tax=Limosilactobacillus oris TaxID=1632 RepID=UPI00242C366C|nr:GNAT family N-acetyltransferase [Limosilactobacillus oris]